MRVELLAVAVLPALAGCFSGSEFPPSASAEQVEEMLAACDFKLRDVALQDRGSDHLVVSIYETEPDHVRKKACLHAEADRRNLSVASVGPLAAPKQGS